MPLSKTTNGLALFLNSLSLTLLLFHFSCTEQTSTSISTNNNATTSGIDSLLQTPNVQEDHTGIPKESEGKEGITPDTTSLSTSTLTKSRAMPKVNRNYVFPYDLENPDFKGNLPKELIEISGLTYNSEDNTLFAINDEVGRLYTLDAKKFNLIDKQKFGSNGDYEGLEIVGDIVYVLKANGNLTPIDFKNPKVKKEIKTALTTANDVEGLGYDPTTNELVLACKGTPALKKKHKLKNTKAFYAFDLDRKELNDYPKFTISDDQLEDFFKNYIDDDLSKKKRKKLKNRLLDFSPSAIAKHPTDDNFYILSSIGKLLLVCNSYGRITDVQFLNDKKFSQPEGICFAPDGTLFISNEGRSVKGTVMRFGQL